MSLLSVRRESPKYFKAKLTLIGVRSDSRLHALCSARGYDVIRDWAEERAKAKL